MLLQYFIIDYDELPISVNNYLKPSTVVKNGRAFVHMYETKEAKDWKKRFRAYLKREVEKQNWDMSVTKDGHWYLDCDFYQSRINQDNNNYYKILCDSLKNIVIVDDKNVLTRTQHVMYDSKHPRFRAILRKVDYIGVFENSDYYNRFVEENCRLCKKGMDKCPILKKALEGRIQESIVFENGSYICRKRKA